ncbi:MAG: transcription termination/antitermination protein NusA, partial [Spirochaetes bacterium]|nr:transcription termination/antitermination protein NusA [Spirochaetota bacterium]
MKANFFEALHQIATEKGITREQLEEIVEAAIFSAYRKQFQNTDSLRVIFDKENNTLKIVTSKMVVNNAKIKSEEVSYNEAVTLYPNVELGDSVDIEEDPFDAFGMIATQTAKQVIIQRIKEAEKNIIYNNYKD